MEEHKKSNAELIEEVAELRAKLQKMEKLNTEKINTIIKKTHESDMVNKYFDAASVMMLVIDNKQNVLNVNKRFCEVVGYDKNELIGKNWYNIGIPENHRKSRKKFFKDLMAGKQDLERYVEVPIVTKSGAERIIAWHNTLIYDSEDNITGTISSGQDITEKQKAFETINNQAREILELSSLVLEVWEGIIAAPLIGTIDSMRTQRFMEHFLSEIVRTHSRIALIDITGVSALDTQTAQHLIEVVTAAKLLGAKIVLTGISPSIAQTMVHLGIDLSGILTKASLASGIRVALEMLNLKIVSDPH